MVQFSRSEFSNHIVGYKNLKTNLAHMNVRTSLKVNDLYILGFELLKIILLPESELWLTI